MMLLQLNGNKCLYHRVGGWLVFSLLSIKLVSGRIEMENADFRCSKNNLEGLNQSSISRNIYRILYTHRIGELVGRVAFLDSGNRKSGSRWAL